MTSAVAGMVFQCVFEGSLSMRDTEIERRPYHKNCGCALHSKGGACSNTCQRNISFPKKQSWTTDGSLCMQASSATFKLSSAFGDASSTFPSAVNRENANGISSLSNRR